MAHIWSLGCENVHYPSNTHLDPHFDEVSYSNFSCPVSTGPFSDGAIRYQSAGGGTRHVTKNFGSSYGTLFFGMWFLSANTSSANGLDMRFLNGTTEMCKFTIPGATTTEKNVAFTDADATVHTATSGIYPSASTWKFMLMKIVFHETAGSFEVRFNGQTALIKNSIDTTGGAGNCTGFMLGGSTNTLYWYADDIVVYDTTGSVLNDWRAPWRIQTVVPTSDGTTTSFTPSTGSDNYAMVDENVLDTDTTYNESATVAQRDEYGIPNGPTGDILGVTVHVAAKTVFAGAADLEIGVISSATEGSAIFAVPADSYRYLAHAAPLNPNTSTAWTETTRNAMQVFYENNGV